MLKRVAYRVHKLQTETIERIVQRSLARSLARTVRLDPSFLPKIDLRALGRQLLIPATI